MNDLTERIAQLEQDLNESRAHEKSLSDLLEKKLNEVYIHYHISRTIGSLLDLREMLRQVFDIIQKSLPFERVSVYLLDEKQEKLDLVFHQRTGRSRQNRPCGSAKAPREESWRTASTCIFTTFRCSMRPSMTLSTIPGEEKLDGSYIGIALKAHNSTIGVIGMDSSAKYGLSVDDMDFMAILSYQLAAGIEKSLLFEKIQQLSQNDGLTGLYNHRIFREKLDQEINRMRTDRENALAHDARYRPLQTVQRQLTAIR